MRAAIDAGLRVLGISDHSPYPFPDGYYSTYRMFPSERADYVRDVQRCREKYADKIEIRLGYEAEYYPRHFRQLIEEINETECEYVILGQHFTNNEYDGEYSGEWDESVEKLKLYVDQVCEAMELGIITYLCHPDLISYCGPEEIYAEQMTRLVEVAIKTDTPLEINLRGIKFKAQYPSDRFLTVAAPLKPKFIIGVDAHDPEDLIPGPADEAAFELVKKYDLDLLDRVRLKKPVL